MNVVVGSLLGYGIIPKSEYSILDRVIGFFVISRPIFFILTPLNAASAAVLALNGFPSLLQCLLGFFTVAFAGGAVNVFNDFIDRKRDKYIWYNRPIPSGRVKPQQALIQVIVYIIISFSIAWFAFNHLTFFILLLAVGLGFLYSYYLRDKLGYLSLPPIVGLIYLGGWAAYSPETLFSSFLPWYLYILGAVWQAAHIMIYYPLHIKRENEKKSDSPIPPAFIVRPSPRTAVYIGTGFTCLTLILAALLPLLAPLGVLYLVLVIVVGIFALFNGISLVRDALNEKKGLKAFAVISILRMTISIAILISILAVN